MIFVENLKAYIFSDECGIEFFDNADLDIQECFLTGKVYKNPDGYEVEIDNIEALIYKFPFEKKQAVGSVNLKNTKISKSLLEDFREKMIEYAISKNNEFDAIDFDPSDNVNF